jgi:hypothetical protein
VTALEGLDIWLAAQRSASSALGESVMDPGRHGMSPNALSRYGSAVELFAWLPILVGHTVRVVSSLGYHPANSKRAQRAIL